MSVNIVVAGNIHHDRSGRQYSRTKGSVLDSHVAHKKRPLYHKVARTSLKEAHNDVWEIPQARGTQYRLEMVGHSLQRHPQKGRPKS